MCSTFSGTITVPKNNNCHHLSYVIVMTHLQHDYRRYALSPTVCETNYSRLMERDPSAKALFANVNVDDVHSPEFGAHVLRVATAITYTIEAVQDENLVEQITSHLAAQHAARNGVKVEHFDVSRFLHTR